MQDPTPHSGIIPVVTPRLGRVMALLASGSAVVIFVVIFWHHQLGLGQSALSLAVVAAALAVILSLAAGFATRLALRPLEQRLLDKRLALHRANEELEAVISASPVGIVTLDAEGRATGHWNRAAEQILGWRREEVLGRLAPWVPPDRVDEFAALRQRVLAGEAVKNLHVTRVRKDGRSVELSLCSALIRGGEGRPDQLVVVFADITEQVADHRTVAFQSLIIRQLTDPVIAYNPRFEVTYWNEAAERLYGWSAEEMQGTYANARLDLEPVGATLDEVRERLRRDGAYEGEFIQTRRDGSRLHVEARSTALRDEAGRLVGYVTANRDLTERRAMEAALRESQARFERLCENVPDVLFRYRLVPDPGYDYVSGAVTAMSGFTPEDFYREPEIALAATHPEDLPRLLALIAEPERLTGEPVVFRFHRKDGSLYWTENRHTAVRDETGRVVAIEWVARDITERIRAEERIRESEERFRRLSENAPDIVYRYRVRPTRVLEYASPALAALSGYSLEEFYQDPDMPRRLLPPEFHHVIDTLGQRPEELEGQGVVLPWRRKDGSTVWVEQRNTLVRDAHGVVVAIEGIARDISERKEWEDRYARLSQVVEQSAEVVIITEISGTIVYVNPAFERLTGYAASEAVGQTPRILKSGLQSPELYAEMWATLNRGESWSGRMRNRRKDGSAYTADVLISPVRDRTGTIVNFVGLQRDMTREHELDEQLRQAQKMEAVGQLTGGIAHDFNNLLTVILANLTLLQDELQDAPGAVPHYLRDIQNAARRGSEMVRKLLAFGRQERLAPRPTDLRRLVADFMHTVGRMLPETIELHATTAEGVPAALADPGAVEQILLNLATNARDAMPGGGAIEVRIDTAGFTAMGDRSVSGWREPGEFVHLAFRDDGEGMDAASLERIFEPFFTTKPTGKGSGLGMPMVYGLMKQHQGFVTVESAPQQGTVVHLYFPVASAEAQARDRPADGEGTPRGTETLLLVEDEEPIRRVATRILEQLGYTVLSARDGLEALETWRANADRIDLLISDVVMPRLNGPDLVARIRAEGGMVRVLLATGYASSDVLKDRAFLGGAMFIEKPWTVDLLARRVRQALQGKGG